MGLLMLVLERDAAQNMIVVDIRRMMDDVKSRIGGAT